MTLPPNRRRELTAELVTATARLALAIAARMPPDTRIAHAAGDVSELIDALNRGVEWVPAARTLVVAAPPRVPMPPCEAGTWPGGEAPDIMGMIREKKETGE